MLAKYIGVKQVVAEPMTIEENREGYRVKYEDGYESWSPKDVFEKAYRKQDGLTMGLAIEAMKLGHKVARANWNGKGMFLYLVGPGNYLAQSKVAKAHWGENALVPYHPYIAIKTVDGIVAPWVASQTDMLGEDWSIVE